MRLVTRFGTYEDCYLKVNRYALDDSPAVQVWNMEDGPIATLTVCLDLRGYDRTGNESFVDTSNLPEAMDFILEYGLGKPNGLRARSGYCTYPMVEFDMLEMEKYKE